MEDNKQASAESLDPTEKEEAVTTIEAREMVEGKLYITYHSRARYFCKLDKVDDIKDCVHIWCYYPQQAEWKCPKVPMTYKLKVLTDDEQKAALEEIAKTTKDTREIFSKMSSTKPKAEGTGRPSGATSGRGMLESWGYYFKEFAHQEGQREKIRAAMKAEFPTKHESIDRWLDAYRGYYNKGRLPPAPVPAVEISKEEWTK